MFVTPFSFHPGFISHLGRYSSHFFSLIFFSLTMCKKMTLSRKNILAPSEDDFFYQKILSYDEICSFDDDDIELLKSDEAFSNDDVFKPFNKKYQPDFVSSCWVCFPEYPFSLGLKYPFLGIISKFFEVTKISYIQAMPIVWRMLLWVNRLNQSKDMSIGFAELAHVYDLTTFRSSCSLLKVKSHKSSIHYRYIEPFL